MISPITSIIVIFSFKNNQAITTETGGTRKNSVAVLLAVPVLIKNCKIVNAPKETNIICQLIDKIKLVEKLMNDFSNKSVIIIRNINALKA